MPESDNPETRRFEQLGVDGVRGMIAAHRFPHVMELHAIEWLAQRDSLERWRNESSQAEQTELARAASEAASRAASAAERQARAADAANTRATMALIVAAVSMIASIIGIWVVHMDTIRPH